MQGINNSYGAFSEPFDTPIGQGLITLHPEMHPASLGIAPTGRYFVFGVHPQFETFTLVVDENAQGVWFTDRQPPFIDQKFIAWIGERIENYSK